MPEVYVFTRVGGRETEAPAERDRPRPGSGEALAALRVAAIGVTA
jgi:hypothetical protein